MRTVKILAALMGIILVLSLTPITLQQGKAKSGGLISAELVSTPILACKYYVDNDFKMSVMNVGTIKTDGSKHLLGGIVTHHLLADSLIAPFFSEISDSKPEIVFVIGPNHERIGQSRINTGSWDWQTPFGILKADNEAVESFKNDCNAGENFDLLESEHSISSLVPYLKYYMPEARIVPVLLHGNYGMKASVELAGKIRKAASGKRWIAIGSIDFSHYLTPAAAEKMDEITLKAINSGDLEAISRMGNDNLDSPPSLITLLEILKEEGDYEMKIKSHSDATKITGKYSDSTTSYFTMLFYKNKV